MWHSLTINFSLLSADIAVVEMSDAFRQPSLFYHLGVRESFSMANNIILYCDTNSESLQSLKVPLNEKMERGKKKKKTQLKTQLYNSCNRFSISMGNTEPTCGSQKNSKNVLRLGKQVYSEVLKNSV